MPRLKTQKDILKIISKDKWQMHVLGLVRDLGLPDWWIGAGFVRNKVFDYLHGYKKRTPLNDVDVIYFDRKNLSERSEAYYQNKLKEKNAARKLVCHESGKDAQAEWRQAIQKFRRWAGKVDRNAHLRGSKN